MLWWTLRQLKSKSGPIRKRAVGKLALVADDRAVGALVAALDDEDDSVRIEAVKALDSQGAPQVIDALLAVLKDRELQVRYWAVMALSRRQVGEAAIPALIGAADRQDSGSYIEMVLTTLRPLRLDSPVAISGMVAALNARNSKLRAFAATRLGESKDATAIEPLLRVRAREADTIVSVAVARGLWNLGWRPSEPESRARFALELQEFDAATALGPAAIGPLVDAARHADASIRGSALEALMQIDDPRARDALASVQKENLDTWIQSGEPAAWVDGHKGKWERGEYAALIATLKQSRFWPMEIAGVSRVIDAARAAWRASRFKATVRSVPGHEVKLKATIEGTKASAMCFSPDGRLLFIAEGNGEVSIFDTVRRESAGELPGHTNGVRLLSFSRDGKFLATANHDSTATIWDAAAFREMHSIDVKADALALSNDGALLAVGTHPLVQIWDIAARRLLRQFNEEEVGCYRALAFSPTAQVLAAGGGAFSGENTVRIWDTNSWREVGLFHWKLKDWTSYFSCYTADIGCLAFSPDGSLLVAGADDGTLTAWSTANWQAVYRGRWWSGVQRIVPLPVARVGILSSAFRPDGKMFATGHMSGHISVWDASTGKVLDTFREHSAMVRSVAFSRDGLLASSGEDESVKLWELTLQ